MDQLQIIEQNGARVLTTSQLAESYGADKQLIVNNFNRNKDRYKEGKHYISLQGHEKNNFIDLNQIELGSKNAKVLYLWTEKGAWLHAKSLNTDQAWDAYEMLVDDYYSVKQQVKVLSEREQLMASMKLTLETAQEITLVKEEVKEVRTMVEQQITLDHGEQRRVQKAIAHKVYETESDPDLRPSRFRELHREIKDRFGVASYKDIKRKDILAAIRYIEAWLPRKVLT
ncbi:ORF6N domain-containing protein [Mesobacillus subterraneus]|uniref:ORF6N domain-containing protein n=1 Tax=Mesobacillus subterraneus TaxID=285983 RepID=UPI00203EBD15|nr:ORF6N domain-containing protein [Mesobacillus subterraneus]MCM3573329.1 ORF6N domain-containing protein [Mesobacillus subterraneus]